MDNMPKPTPPPPVERPLTPSSPVSSGSGDVKLHLPINPTSEGGGDERAIRGVTPLNWSKRVLEEVEDSHLSIVCKFISEDQV